MRFFVREIITLAVVGTASSAEGQINPIPIEGPLRHIQYGESGQAKSAPRIIYSNTLGGQYVTLLIPSSEYIDWGVIAASEDHEVVTDLSFGYGAFGPTAAFRYRVYDDYTGFCGNLGSVIFDMSLTGLPGSPTGAATGWVVSLDLEALGKCFFLVEGPFGYSYAYLGNGQTGPLHGHGGTGTSWEFDVIEPDGSCNTWFGGNFYSWYTELGARDGHDTFPGGCGGGLALEIGGPTCTGSTVTIRVSGADLGDWWAVALGTNIGAGIGGTLGGCPIDVVPVIPIRVMGQLPTQPLTFPATVSFASGLAVGLQVITKNPTSNTFDSSNTEIIQVP